jgi:hypothetical protein
MVVILGQQGEIQKQVRYTSIRLGKQTTRRTATWAIKNAFPGERLCPLLGTQRGQANLFHPG